MSVVNLYALVEGTNQPNKLILLLGLDFSGTLRRSFDASGNLEGTSTSEEG